MCGILGCFLNRPLQSEEVRPLHEACASLNHRGPDASGEFADLEKGLYLGHRRLKIIDLSESSAQPMVRGNHVITYNGEIYNFRELAEGLKNHGVELTSQGDTEVLLQSWIKDADKTLDHLDGMFAFALFDGEKLHLATDPFGEKPLYVMTRPEGVYFSSEPQPLLALADISFAPSEEDVAAFIALGFFPGAGTGFPGLEKLEPASYFIVERGAIKKRSRYWTPPQSELRSGPVKPIGATDLDAIEACFLRSIERRLVSDVPLGLFLSSGVDSVLIATLIARELKRDIQAYTVAFPDGVDESESVGSITRHLGLDHKIIESGADGSTHDLPGELLKIYGEPNDNTTALAVRQMSKAARSYITVALSGTGGDELFMGYQKYEFLNDKQGIYRWLGPIVDMVRPILGSSLDWLRPWKQARDYVFSDPAWQFLAVKNNGCSDLLCDLPGMDDVATKLFGGDTGASAFQAHRFDLLQTLPFSYIASIDRGSMQASLEVRTPFLSRELFELVSQLDQRALLAFGRKKVAYDLLARHLPDELINRKKQGFVMPLNTYSDGPNSSARCLHGLDAGWTMKLQQMHNGPAAQRLALRADILSHAVGPARPDHVAA